MFYLVAPRGLDRLSSIRHRVARNEVISSLSQLEGLSPIPIESINMQNIVKDMEAVLKIICKSSEFDPKISKISLYGESLGARIAYRLLQHLHQNNENTASLEVHSAVLQSMPSPIDFTNPSNDFPVISSCESDPYCKAMFGKDPRSYIARALREIINTDNTYCSVLLIRHLSKGMASHKGSLGDKLRLFLQPLLEGRVDLGPGNHSLQLALLFIRATWLCEDEDYYEAKILQEIIRLVGNRQTAHPFGSREWTESSKMPPASCTSAAMSFWRTVTLRSSR